TSLMTEEPGGVAKTYGSQEVEVDMARLQADIASGKVQGVEVISPDQLQEMIRADIERLRPGFDADAAIADGPSGIDEHLRNRALGRGLAGRLSPRLLAPPNPSRDGEWLVRGVIPHDYITGPYPTTPPPGAPPSPGSPPPAPPAPPAPSP